MDGRCGVVVALVLIAGLTVTHPSPAGATCGDSVVDVGEQCDDGNTVGGDCCSDACLLEVICPTCETCDPSVGTCRATPIPTCHEPTSPGKVSLHLKDNSTSIKDKIVWKWLRGQATSVTDFGAPVSDTDYTLCVYDESGPTPQVTMRALVPPGGVCGGRPCWAAVGQSRFKYRSAEAQPNGITKILLNAGTDGVARIVVKGKGLSLGLPPLPFNFPFRIQLQNEDGQCWESHFLASGVVRNDGVVFAGKAGTP